MLTTIPHIVGSGDDSGTEFVVSRLFTIITDTKYLRALLCCRAGLECCCSNVSVMVTGTAGVGTAEDNENFLERLHN